MLKAILRSNRMYREKKLISRKEVVSNIRERGFWATARLLRVEISLEYTCIVI